VTGELSVRADRLKRAHPIVADNNYVASRMLQDVTFKLWQKEMCLCARCPIKLCSPSRQLDS